MTPKTTHDDDGYIEITDESEELIFGESLEWTDPRFRAATGHRDIVHFGHTHPAAITDGIDVETLGALLSEEHIRPDDRQDWGPNGARFPSVRPRPRGPV